MVDEIVVIKGERELVLMSKGKANKTYRISLGGEPLGPKRCQGDNRTPEGTYVVDWKTNKSRYHKALHVSYPNRQDIEASRKLGCPPGGDIMIHGLPRRLGWLGRLHRLLDWTRGCIAVTNAEIEEIYDQVREGTPIRIDP